MSESNLSKQQCEPCRGGIPPLTPDECQTLLNQLDNGWKVIDGHHLKKTFPTSNFVTALDLTNAIGQLAESVGHHPNITLTWGSVDVSIWTHKIDGLHNADFILAAKIDALL